MTIGLTGVMHAHDIGLTQPHRLASGMDKMARRHDILGNVWSQHLNRHRALVQRVMPAVNNTSFAMPEFANDAIRADLLGP